MIKESIGKVVSGNDLSRREMYNTFNEIMSGKATPAQIGAFITALRMKGETVDEITGAVKVMREKAVKVTISSTRGQTASSLVDTCGTGGSGTNVFNVSTCVAFIIAACGVKVAKHGNRSASSRCGSADVLERLGVNINTTPDKVAKCIETVGIGFLFAPLFHGAMRFAIGPRREIGIRTIFNILGPLSNPAGAGRQIVGVYDRKLVPVLAGVLKNLGTKKAFIVHGADNLDEITISGKTLIAELKNKSIRTRIVSPGDFGVKRANLNAIKGGSPDVNAKIIGNVLNGKKGPARDVVLINASAALVVADKVKNFKEGVRLACEVIDTGRALQVLNDLKQVTNQI